MTRRSKAGCLSLALTLAALIRWELTSPPAPAALAATADPAVSSPTPFSDATVPEQRSAAMASSILRRPLFRADRRPAPAAVPDAPPLPRLSGIVITASARRAIFAGGRNGKPVVAAEGYSFGPVRVARIGAREVVMIGPDGAHVLRPIAQSAPERAPLAVLRPGNTVGAAGATFGAIPTDRLVLLRGRQATSVHRLRTAPW
jgi:hypothetical protein